MENVQKTRRLFASAYGCKASRSFLIWGLSAAMSISVIPVMAEISVGEKNYDTQIVSQTKTITGTIIDDSTFRCFSHKRYGLCFLGRYGPVASSVYFLR